MTSDRPSGRREQPEGRAERPCLRGAGLAAPRAEEGEHHGAAAQRAQGDRPAALVRQQKIRGGPLPWIPGRLAVQARRIVVPARATSGVQRVDRDSGADPGDDRRQDDQAGCPEPGPAARSSIRRGSMARRHSGKRRINSSMHQARTARKTNERDRPGEDALSGDRDGDDVRRERHPVPS